MNRRPRFNGVTAEHCICTPLRNNLKKVFDPIENGFEKSRN